MTDKEEVLEFSRKFEDGAGYPPTLKETIVGMSIPAYRIDIAIRELKKEKKLKPHYLR